MMVFLEDVVDLPTQVMEWWEKHQHDCDGEWNIYDEEPSFVGIARTILRQREEKE